MITEVRLRPLRNADFDRVLELERRLFGRGAWTYGMLADELAGLGRWYIVAEPERLDRAGTSPSSATRACGSTATSRRS